MKFLSFLLLIAALVLPLSSRIQAEERLAVGLVIPATGIAGEYGQAILNALELAKEDFPELNKRVDFIIEDSRYEGSTTTKAFLKLVDVDKVDIIYVWGSTPAETAAPLAYRRRVPTILASGDWKLCSKTGHVLCFMPPFERFGLALMSHLALNKRTKIGIVAADLVFFHKVIEGMKTALKDEKIEIIDFVAPSDQDFRPLLSKLRRKKYDALGVFLIPGQVRNFYLQADQLGIKFSTFGTDVFESKTEIEAAKGGMSGAYFASLPLSDLFSKRYRERFGNDIQISFAGNAFDFFSAVARTVRSSSPESSILERFRRQFPHEGTTGLLSLEEHGVTSPVAIKEITGDTITTIKSF